VAVGDRVGSAPMLEATLVSPETPLLVIPTERPEIRWLGRTWASVRSGEPTQSVLSPSCVRAGPAPNDDLSAMPWRIEDRVGRPSERIEVQSTSEVELAEGCLRGGLADRVVARIVSGGARVVDPADGATRWARGFTFDDGLWLAEDAPVAVVLVTPSLGPHVCPSLAPATVHTLIELWTQERLASPAHAAAARAQIRLLLGSDRLPVDLREGGIPDEGLSPEDAASLLASAESLVAACPDDPAALWIAARVATEAQLYGLAHPWLDRLEMSPARATAQAWIGFALEEPALVLQGVRAALALAPDDPWALLLLGLYRTRVEGADDAAADVFGEVTPHPQAGGIAWLSLARLALTRGDLHRARRAFHSAARTDATWPLPLLELADALVSWGEGEEAREILDTLQAHWPDRAAVWTLVAEHLAEVDEDYEGAIDAARRAIALDDGSADGWLLLGTLLGHHAGDIPAARSAFSEAARLLERPQPALAALDLLDTLPPLTFERLQGTWTGQLTQLGNPVHVLLSVEPDQSVLVLERPQEGPARSWRGTLEAARSQGPMIEATLVREGARATIRLVARGDHEVSWHEPSHPLWRHVTLTRRAGGVATRGVPHGVGHTKGRSISNTR
jgi:tetratricopeptide (TPR) repeat protein